MYLNKLHIFWFSVLFVLLKNDIYCGAGGPYCTYNRTRTKKAPVLKSNEKNESFIIYKTTIEWKLERDCCEGYKKINQGICVAICNNHCDNNAICIAPNTCKCKDGYLEVPINNQCLPNCKDMCPPNSLCIAPLQCECIEGYRAANGECVPICTAECRNGFCSAPEKCECNKNFKLQNGLCRLFLEHISSDIRDQPEEYEKVNNLSIENLNALAEANAEVPTEVTDTILQEPIVPEDIEIPIVMHGSMLTFDVDTTVITPSTAGNEAEGTEQSFELQEDWFKFYGNPNKRSKFYLTSTTNNYETKVVNNVSFDNSKKALNLKFSMNESHTWGNIFIACVTLFLLVLIAFWIYFAFFSDYGKYDVEDRENFHCDFNNNKNYNELRCN